MPVNPIWGNIFKFRSDTLTVLREAMLFRDLSFFELRKVARILHRRSYLQHEVVLHEKEPGTGMYIVKSGKLKVFVQNSDGTEQILAILEEGDFFGEGALIDESSSMATVVATEDSELLGLFRADLMELIDRDPRLSANILMQLAGIMAQRLREADLSLNSRHV